MSTQPIAAYSFLPWARQGLGIFIREGDQQAGVSERGSIDVSLQITGERLSGGTGFHAHAVQMTQVEQHVVGLSCLAPRV